MYRTIDAKFWTDPKVRKLTVDGKLFMLYLVTNPHSHLSGFYYLPRSTMTSETGISGKMLNSLCDTLSRAGLAYFDPENDIVFVYNMLNYQGRGQKNESSAAKQVQTFMHSPLVAKFTARYPKIKIPSSYPIQSQDGAGTQEQEQDKDKDKDKDKEQDIDASASCSEPNKSASEQTLVPVDALLEFPTVGKATRWYLTQQHINDLTESFPDLDVLAECRKALGWIRNNMPKRKTPKGMPRFLFYWLSKSQDSRGGKANGAAQHDPRGNLAARQSYLQRFGDG